MMPRKMLSRRRFLTIAAAGLACPAGAVAREWRGYALGADVRLKLAGDGDRAGRIWRKVARELRRIEAQFSLFADSDLTRLNANGRLGWPSRDMLALMRLSDALHGATGAAFDPSVQPLWQAVARGQDRATARTHTGWHRVSVTEHEIRLPPGMALTLNGIAQGFAADRLAALLRAEGFSDVLIDAGEIQALGRAANRDWQAAIAGPKGGLLRRVSLHDRALATSSPMGTRIGDDQPHILHPDGRATQWNTVSVSAPSAALADGLSTAFCLMKRAEITAALAQFPGANIEFLG